MLSNPPPCRFSFCRLLACYPAARLAFLLLLGGMLVGFAACSSAPNFDEPPEIRYGEDTCERCLMIINEARYAAAYVTADGETSRFDDIGGMIAHHRDMLEDVAVFWVHDFDTEAWLKAEDAFFVKSDEQHTPMGFGIVAFSSQDRAAEWASEQSGVVLTFDDLMTQAEAAGALGQEHDHDDHES